MLCILHVLLQVCPFQITASPLADNSSSRVCKVLLLLLPVPQCRQCCSMRCGMTHLLLLWCRQTYGEGTVEGARGEGSKSLPILPHTSSQRCTEVEDEGRTEREGRREGGREEEKGTRRQGRGAEAGEGEARGARGGGGAGGRAISGRNVQ